MRGHAHKYDARETALEGVAPDADPHFEVVHGAGYLTIWRPSDTEVWATLADGSNEQIGGFADHPAPWLDSTHPDIGPPPWNQPT